MNTRQNRLNEVYNDLRSRGIVHTKTDFAAVLHYGRTSMAAALNGSDAYLTDSLFKNVCGKFQYYDLNYLLTGEGRLLLEDAPGASEGSAERDATIAALEELVDTQRVLIEALRERLRSLGVEYIATVTPSHSRAYDTPAPTPFIAPAAEPSDQSPTSETSPNVSPNKKKKRDK
jgi:hypothetical protein